MAPGRILGLAKRWHRDTRRGDRWVLLTAASPSPQGASVHSLAEEQGLSRFAWVGIRGGKTRCSGGEVCLRAFSSGKWQ